jgi:hypothetical protein
MTGTYHRRCTDRCCFVKSNPLRSIGLYDELAANANTVVPQDYENENSADVYVDSSEHEADIFDEPEGYLDVSGRRGSSA